MTEEELQRVLDEAFEFLQAELPGLENEGIGGALMVRLASLTNGFYGALRRRMDKHQALSLTRDTAWRIYTKTGRIPWVLSGLGAKGRTDRLRWATNAFRSFPFGPPAYVMVDVELDEPNIVAFDVTRCPVAEYFLLHDRGEVCLATWCSLDFPLAEQWDATLIRDTAIANGDDRCEFRWRPST